MRFLGDFNRRISGWLSQTTQPGDSLRTLKIGVTVLAVGLGGFLIWAIFAPLDEGVPTQGVVTVDTKRKTIQHFTGGIIEAVYVKEAETVQAGQVLLKLVDTSTRANYETARQRYIGLRVMQSRLQAEQNESEKFEFHQDVRDGTGDPEIQKLVLSEQRHFSNRRLALKNEMAAMDESIAVQREAAKGFSAQLESRQQQTDFIREERAGIKSLVEEGYAPRTKLLELERNLAEVSAIISDLKSNVIRAKKSAVELSLKKIQRQQEYQREVASQLTDIQREIVASSEKFRAAEDDLNRVLIKAPVNGAVVGIATQTVGGVIPPGGRIMDIVPKDEVLILETRIPPQLVDSLRVGQLADIHFSGFKHTPQLVIEGKLRSISADLLSDANSNTSYYLGRIEVTPAGLAMLGTRELQPGMPAEVIIKTGERTLLTYFIGPLLRRLSQSMKET